MSKDGLRWLIRKQERCGSDMDDVVSAMIITLCVVLVLIRLVGCAL